MRLVCVIMEHPDGSIQVIQREEYLERIDVLCRKSNCSYVMEAKIFEFLGEKDETVNNREKDGRGGRNRTTIDAVTEEVGNIPKAPSKGRTA